MLKYFRMLHLRLIQRQPDVGNLITEASILLLVLVGLLLGGALIFSLLMILTQSKTLSLLLFWSLIMSGILVVLVKDFNQEGP